MLLLYFTPVKRNQGKRILQKYGYKDKTLLVSDILPEHLFRQKSPDIANKSPIYQKNPMVC